MKSLEPKSLNVFTIDSPLRLFCCQLATSPYFQKFIILCLITNCIILALYNIYIVKGHDNATLQHINTVNGILTIVFLLEACIHIVHKGFIMHVDSYLRSGWAALDIIVIVSG